MRAIVVRAFGGPEVLGLEEVATPVPGPREVLVRVRAAGVNPVETYLRTGTYAPPPPLPYTPGSDAGGVVEAVGAGASVVVGQRVFTAGSISGTYAELALCSADQVFALPERVTFAQGAALGVPYATAWRALFQRARAVPGEAVLVHGASGGVGVASVQMARAAGLRTVGTAGTEAGRRLVLAEGAHAVLDHGAPGYLDEALALTGGRGFDVVIEMLANVNLARDLPLLAPLGRVVVVGSRGAIEIAPRDLMRCDGAVLGLRLTNASPTERASLFAGIVAGLEAGTLRPVVGRELSLADAAVGHRDIMATKALGKIVLLP